MTGYAQIQALRTKLKPFRKHPGHYIKSPEIKLLLQENAAACAQFMAGKPATELSTINTKVLLHWAECLYALARKFSEYKLLTPACEKYELVAKYTMGAEGKDFSVYCKWGTAECEKSLHSVFYKDGKGKKGKPQSLPLFSSFPIFFSYSMFSSILFSSLILCFLLSYFFHFLLLYFTYNSLLLTPLPLTSFLFFLFLFFFFPFFFSFFFSFFFFISFKHFKI
jgi:hypothetical protein